MREPRPTSHYPLPTTLFSPCRRLSRQMQTFVDRVERQFQAVRNAELVEDVVEMVLHRLLADEHLFGHLFVLVPLRDQGDDFALAGTQRATLAALAARRAARFRAGLEL